jgi:vacuolar protein sorting-associated protein 11
VAEWGCIFVLTGDGKFYRLEEKDTQTKLENLFKKNLYPVAINLAYSQQLDHASIVDIYRRYGDHLYRYPKEKENEKKRKHRLRSFPDQLI